MVELRCRLRTEDSVPEPARRGLFSGCMDAVRELRTPRELSTRRGESRLGPIEALGVLLAGLFTGCGEPAPSGFVFSDEGSWFEDVTEEVGIDFDHDPGPLPGEGDPHFMPQMAGSGGALLDFDGDGLLDIYLQHNGGPGSGATNRLYRQDPGCRFRDVSAGSGLDVDGYGMGVAAGDVDNDGLPDVVLAEYGATRLFLNSGAGKFRECGREAGIENSLWAISAGLLDYDRDGWLDLALANYVAHDGTKVCLNSGKPDFCGPVHYPGTVAKLWHNEGRVGTAPVRFEEVTERVGLGRVSAPGLGVVCADLTGDRWPDILVSNDANANHLWVNQGDGTFEEEGFERGIALTALGQKRGNMGIALGDIDGDSLLDVFITHLAVETHTLWKQEAAGQFRDVTDATGLARPLWQSTGFGTVLADFDQDGDLDLAIVNGGVVRRPKQVLAEEREFWDPYKQRNQLFENDGQGRFHDVSLENRSFCELPGVSRGLAWGDVDGDGALDLLVTRTDGRAGLYRNVAPNRGHWLRIRCIDPALGGRDAYGAEVTVTAGDRRWRSLVNPGQSYAVSGDPRVHFGLGEATRVDSVRVIWPDGSEELFPSQDVDREIVLSRGEGRTIP